MLELPEGVRRVTRGRRTYWYYHQGRGTLRAKRAVALPGDPTDPAFWQTLRDFTGQPFAEDGSFAHLIDRYRNSPEFAFLRPLTRKGYEVYLRGFERAWGELQVAALSIAGIYAHRDGMAKTPVAANQMLSVLRTFLAWCLPRGHVKQNVAAAVQRLGTEDRGTRPWPDAAYRFVIAHAPEDLRRMAFLGRATGQRRSDLIRMRPIDRHEQGIRLRIGKLREKAHWVPLTKADAAEIDSWGVEPMVQYLISPAGKAYSGDHLNSRWNRWRESEDAKPIAGLELSIHGLRATAVVDRRRAGLTHQEIAAQIGMSLQMVMAYSRYADQEDLAREGMRRLEERPKN